jgi:ADP-ribosylglycohydrolase
MDETAKAMVLASFAADSLALGPHWIYDQKRIESLFGRVDRLLQPGSGSQHRGKRAGEQTHYGDQALILLDSLASRHTFDLSDFASRWQRLFADYPGYIDQATRGTLQGFGRGEPPERAGSKSTDLAGASRIAPLVCLYRSETEQAVQAARAQTQMTHATGEVVDAAEFFARTGMSVLAGEQPVQAMERAAEIAYAALPAGEWLDKGMRLAGEATGPAVQSLGLSCHIDEAFPATVQIITRFQDDLRQALIECVMAGGDSAARGMLIGMVLGASLGLQGVPDEWLDNLRARSRIEDRLQSILAG